MSERMLPIRVHVEVEATDWWEVEQAFRDLIFDMKIAKDGSLTREILRVSSRSTVRVNCEKNAPVEEGTET